MAVFYTNWSFTGTSTPNGETYVVDGQNVTYYNDVRYKFVTSESLDSANNRSKVTVYKYATFYYTWNDTPPGLNIKMNSQFTGFNAQTETKLVPPTKSQTYTLVGSDVFYINHESDGTKTTTFSGVGSYTGGSGKEYKRSVSARINLTNINLASSVTSNATSSTKFGDTITFTITKKISNNDYLHDLTYSMYNSSGTIGTDLSATKTWVIPTSLINSTPDNDNPIITITCSTKIDGKVIGSSTYSFNCKVPDNYIPTCSLAIEEAGNTPASWGVYIQNQSKIKGTITTGKNVSSDTATIKSYITNSFFEATSVNNYVTNPFTSLNFLSESGTYTIKSQVKDSRGRSSAYNTNNTKQIEVLPYEVPTIKSVAISRCDSNGTVNEEGTYAKLTIDYEISPCNNKNAKSIVVTQGSQKSEIILSEYSGQVVTSVFSNLSTSNSYVFNVNIIDTFYNDIKQPITLQPSFITRSYRKGGKGITYGRDATQDGIHDYIGTEFHNGVKTNTINVDGLKVEKHGTIYIGYIE